MVNKTIYPITNPEYQFAPTDFPPINGYLIVGKKDDRATLFHFGENAMPHDKAVEWFKQQKVTVVRVYTGGQMSKLMQLKERLDQKPIDKAIGELERELLK